MSELKFSLDPNIHVSDTLLAGSLSEVRDLALRRKTRTRAKQVGSLFGWRRATSHMPRGFGDTSSQRRDYNGEKYY